MKIIVIVPAFNEEKNIVDVINSIINENPSWDILVINDGSKDDTGINARMTNKALVIDLPCNLGIGGAVQTGFKYARNNNYDIALQFDGDGQHMAYEINSILKPIIANEADMVIGSRFLQKSSGWRSSFSRRIGIKIFEIINSIIIKQKITDNTSGFRAFNKKTISLLSDYYPVDYPEPEAVIIVGRSGFIIQEVFVEMQSRQQGKSTISGLGSIYYMIKVIIAIFINTLRPKL